ncbi:MAG: 50S ribosomal protein L11 methyltransferase [Clostridia bacterium]
MEWLEVKVKTTTEGSEVVAAALYELGITGLQIIDNHDVTEFINNKNSSWDYISDELLNLPTEEVTVIAYVRDNEIGYETLLSIRSSMDALVKMLLDLELGSLTIEIDNIKNSDWENNWKAYYKPFPVGKKLLVKPVWENIVGYEDRIILEMDPQLVFGTGTHQTTKFCLEQLEQKILPGMKVLDLGCGSGILSVAALVLGAKMADAIDIDANAIKIATANAEMNHIVLDSYRVYSGNILKDEKIIEKFTIEKYDVVLANIVADVIIALSTFVADFMLSNGIFIASGIIDSRLEEVKTALRIQKLDILYVEVKNEWAVIVAEKQEIFE